MKIMAAHGALGRSPVAGPSLTAGISMGTPLRASRSTRTWREDHELLFFISLVFPILVNRRGKCSTEQRK